MARKIQKSERQKAIDKADKYCSLYCRLSHADHNGICTCYTCGKKLHWKKIQCGHRIGRMSIVVRRDLDNVRPQCVGCNDKRRGNGRPVVFKANLIDEIGEDRVKDIDDRALAEVRDPVNNKVYTPEILEIAEHYKELLKPYKHLMT